MSLILNNCSETASPTYSPSSGLLFLSPYGKATVYFGQEEDSKITLARLVARSVFMDLTYSM